MLCAERSPQKYITRALKNCVVYGRWRCERPYAEKAFDKGPRRCHKGRGATVLGTGIDAPCVAAVSKLALGIAAPVAEGGGGGGVEGVLVAL
jgi:hypothetical protein